MKNCIRIPKVYIPRKDFEAWAALGTDRFAADPRYKQRVERAVGDLPSALRFLLPQECSGEELIAHGKEVREAMYRLLEDSTLEKLNRGAVLAERETEAGLRRGLVMCIDLDAYTMPEGDTSLVRPSQQFDMAEAERIAEMRKLAPLEFPHIVLFYRDKRDKIMHWLGDDLEEIYSVELQTGNLRGYFIPAFEAVEIASDLHTRGEPCFVVADGEEELAAAKLHWESLKQTIQSEEELAYHPARFALVEFVNLHSDAVTLEPLHRLVTGVETEVFCDWFARQIKCKRSGNLLYPAVRDGAEAVRKTDELIATFLRQNGGQVKAIREEQLFLAEHEDCAAVVLKGIDQEDLFSYLKGGKILPAHTFAFGKERDGRYHFEGREISYD